MTPWVDQTAAARSPSPRGIRERLTSWISDKELSREFWMFFVAALCFDFGFAVFLFLYNLLLLDIGFNERQLGLVSGRYDAGQYGGYDSDWNARPADGPATSLVWGLPCRLP